MEDKEIQITLKGSVWNVILNAIASRPYSEVASLIEEIRRQATAQINETPQPTGE